MIFNPEELVVTIEANRVPDRGNPDGAGVPLFTDELTLDSYARPGTPMIVLAHPQAHGVATRLVRVMTGRGPLFVRSSDIKHLY